MNKGNLGNVKEVRGEERGAKNAALTTHTLPTPARKPDAAKTAKMITTRDVKRGTK